MCAVVKPKPRLATGPVFAGRNVLRKREPVLADEHVLTEQQEALHLSFLPRTFGTKVLAEKLSLVLDKHVADDRVLMMRSRLGESTGQAIIQMRAKELPSLQVVIEAFPAFVKIAPFDYHETRIFVEKCERFQKQSDDLRRLAVAENLHRVVTLTGIPDTYGRLAVMELLKKTAGVTVGSPRDVVFQFDKYGMQKDICYVILSSEAEVEDVLKSVVEVAVPRKTVYGASFGCEFVSSSRSHLFMASEPLDYALHGSKYWVMSLGWDEGTSVDDFSAVMVKRRIQPIDVRPITCESDKTTAFLMKFERMKDAKETMVKFHSSKVGDKVTYAYPVQADVHWFGDKVHADGRADDDGDLDEPIDY
jgi:hypothetical protein